MSVFVKCPHCALTHRARDTGACPRCKRHFGPPSAPVLTGSLDMTDAAEGRQSVDVVLFVFAALPVALSVVTVVWSFLPDPLMPLLPAIILPLLPSVPIPEHVAGLTYISQITIPTAVFAAFPYLLCCATALLLRRLFEERRLIDQPRLALSTREIIASTCLPYYNLYGIYRVYLRLLEAFERGDDTERVRTARFLATAVLVVLIPRFSLVQLSLVLIVKWQMAPHLRWSLSLIELLVLLMACVVLARSLRSSVLDFLQNEGRRPTSKHRSPQPPHSRMLLVAGALGASLLLHVALLQPLQKPPEPATELDASSVPPK